MTRSARVPAATAKRRQRPSPTGAAPARTEAGHRPLKIGEAARRLGVEPYVLRFWETQFAFLRPRHAASSHRMYEPRDLELLRLVKGLLHVQGYTIAGAKKRIREVGLEQLCSADGAGGALPSAKHASPTAPVEIQRTLAEIRDDLQSLCRLLER